MRGLLQIVPRPIPTRSQVAWSPAPAACEPTDAASLNPNHQATALDFVQRHDPTSRQAQNPRTIASRSHPSSLAVSTSERTPSNSGWPGGIASRCPGRRADRPNSVRAGGLTSASICNVLTTGDERCDRNDHARHSSRAVTNCWPCSSRFIVRCAGRRAGWRALHAALAARSPAKPRRESVPRRRRTRADHAHRLRRAAPRAGG